MVRRRARRRNSMANSLADAGAAIGFDDFVRVDLRVGTVLTAEPNARATKPAYLLKIDFGTLGRMTTSAQLTERYAAGELVGRQVVAVVNLPPRIVAGVASEVLVLGALPAEG